jgi:hypothetical protein
VTTADRSDNATVEKEPVTPHLFRRARGLLVVLAALVTAVGCNEPVGQQSNTLSARVRLTDAPFPFDRVSRVDVHIVSVDATEDPDTTAGTVAWTNIAAPRQTFNLLALQRGVTAVIGEGAIPAGQYSAVRLVIDTERSSITLTDGSAATVQWPVLGELALHALVQDALATYAPGTEMNVVIDFDVGRSFQFVETVADTVGTNSSNGYFVFIPWIRAVNDAGTGGIEGTVTADLDGDGTVEPVENASISVMGGDPAFGPLTWYTVATGRTDAAGTFVVDFLLVGSYIVQAAPPHDVEAGSAALAGLNVAIGQRTKVNLELPAADPAHLEIVGAGMVQLNHEIVLRAVMLDANGDTLSGQPVSWNAWPADLVTLADPRDGSAPVREWVGVTGRNAGVVSVRATSLGLFDAVSVQVVDPSAPPVATVELSPASQTVAVFDSLAIAATVKDAQSNVLLDRLVTWAVSDTTVLRLELPGNAVAHFTALETGNATVTATSEGKTGTATVTVN